MANREGTLVGVDAVIAAMYARPLDFTLSEFTLSDSKTGAEIWIANGWGFYGIHRPAEFSFSLWDQFKFARAFKKWRAAWLAHKFVPQTSEAA